jgi:plastocyanin
MQNPDTNWVEKRSGLSRRGFLKLLGSGLLGLPLLAACSRTQTGYHVVKIMVEQSESHFDPASLTIPKGATVIWQNMSYYLQSATCDPSKAPDKSFVSLPPGAQPWDSGELYPGQTYRHTFQTPGTYLYFSRYLEQPSTIATIQVTE